MLRVSVDPVLDSFPSLASSTLTLRRPERNSRPIYYNPRRPASREFRASSPRE